ncbi:MAG: hypothetical protein KAT04_04135 [Methylococcales bacterium]|nr:hypothetical protein [Methylococcales bacterium]
MTIEKELQARSESKCELCRATENLNVYEVPPTSNETADECVLICETCRQQIENPEKIDVHHWRCLNDSMWSQIAAVQVMSWRMLSRLKTEGWAQDLLEMMHLDEETLTWAQATAEGASDEDVIKHLDSNGAVLEAGDSVPSMD